VTTVKVQYAKTHLSALLHEVERGAEVVIARGDRAVARLVPVQAPGRERELGFVPYEVPDTFADDLPEEELAAWETGR
jgi:antitoxin (DNA-binding transcriptional repressor) of toxin-antitoxin stability system